MAGHAFGHALQLVLKPALGADGPQPKFSERLGNKWRAVGQVMSMAGCLLRWRNGANGKQTHDEQGDWLFHAGFLWF